MKASGSRNGSNAARPGSGRNRTSIYSLGADLLFAIFAHLDHLELVRCSVVCKSWNSLIYQGSIMRDLYYEKNQHIQSISDMSIPLETSMKMYFKEMAMDQHRLALTGGSAEIHQWTGHSVRVNMCRMKRGVILTGVGDKVMRLWSAESCKYLDEYFLPDINPLVDYDFDENKIVGLNSARICIWRRSGQRSIFKSREGIFPHGLCMRYIDPEAVIGCEDGRAHIFDIYSGSCSRIIRMHSGPVTCLALTDDQLIFGGSTFGSITVADLSSGEQMGILKSSFSPTGMKSLCFNPHSFLIFAGSTAGYAHCWDLRTFRPVWEVRASPNVIYALHHLSSDTSTLAIGGLDGVLRILNQSTGEIISSLVENTGGKAVVSLKDGKEVVEKKAVSLSEVYSLESIARYLRPPITCLAVGMKKVVTTHNDKFVRLWKF